MIPHTLSPTARAWLRSKQDTESILKCVCLLCANDRRLWLVSIVCLFRGHIAVLWNNFFLAHVSFSVLSRIDEHSVVCWLLMIWVYIWGHRRRQSGSDDAYSCIVVVMCDIDVCTRQNKSAHKQSTDAIFLPSTSWHQIERMHVDFANRTRSTPHNHKQTDTIDPMQMIYDNTIFLFPFSIYNKNHKYVRTESYNKTYDWCARALVICREHESYKLHARGVRVAVYYVHSLLAWCC